MQPSSRHKFRALRLGVPSVIAQFETVLKSEEGKIVDTRMYNVDLNSGTAIDWHISLQVSTPGPTTLVPAGWYVATTEPSHRHDLLAGLPVNTLSGWDVSKLGWLKAGRRGYSSSSLEQLRQKFIPTVESCAEGKHSGYFSHAEIDRHKYVG